MAEPQPSIQERQSSALDEPNARRGRAPVLFAVWLLLSVAFVAFLLFGSVDARIWRFGRLRIESKSISRIWEIQADNLPALTADWFIQTVFYGSIAVFVACVIIGMRFLLDQAGSDASPATNDQA